MCNAFVSNLEGETLDEAVSKLSGLPSKSKLYFKIKLTIFQTVRVLMCHMVPILKYAYYQ